MMKRSASPEDCNASSSESPQQTSAKRPKKEPPTSSAMWPQTDWDQMFERLARFKEETGHANVPLQCEEDPELGAWVAQMRQTYKDTSGTGKDPILTQDRIEKMTKLGFDWTQRNPRHLQWETRFAQLQAFKKKYGHVQVPIQWEENVQLANWVSKQRQEYKNLLRGRTTRLDENRIRLLNSVGFAWQLQRGGRRRQLKAKKDGDGGGSDLEQKKDSDGAILPGEVLIGQGAPPQMSPNQFSRKKGKKKGTKITGGGENSALAASDPSAAAFMQAQGNNGQNNNELLAMILARNALLHNLQRQPMNQQQGAAAGQMQFMGGFAPNGAMQNQNNNASNPNSHLLDSIRMQSGQMPMPTPNGSYNMMQMQGMPMQGFPGPQIGHGMYQPQPFATNQMQQMMQFPGSTAPSWLMSAQAQHQKGGANNGNNNNNHHRSDPPEVRLDGTDHSKNMNHEMNNNNDNGNAMNSPQPQSQLAQQSSRPQVPPTN